MSEEVDWTEVRKAYELSEETVRSILDRFGLSRYQLEKRRVAENWTTRPAVASRESFGRRRPPSIGSQALAFRMNRLVTIGLAMLEKRISEEGMTEANARTLTELARAQEIRMRSDRNKKAAKAREKKNSDAGNDFGHDIGGQDFRDDPDWLLAEINRRLDRLAEAAEPSEAGGAASEDPEGEGA